MSPFTLAIGGVGRTFALVLGHPSFGIDLRHEKRARPLRSTHSCPPEEDPPLSELDCPEESDPLSASEDSLLDSAQQACGAVPVLVAALARAVCSFRRLSSSALSRAKSSAVKAHLSALGLLGVVLEKKKVQLPVGAPKRDVPTAERRAVAEQKEEFGGMLIGGGILFRFTERELGPGDALLVDGLRAEIGVGAGAGAGTGAETEAWVPVEEVGALIGDTILEADEEPMAPETLRFSRGPRRVCAGLESVVVVVAPVVEDTVEVAGTGTLGTGGVAVGTLLTGNRSTAKGAGGERRGRSESWRRRKIISAETRQSGDKEREGRAGDNGVCLVEAVGCCDGEGET